MPRLSRRRLSCLVLGTLTGCSLVTTPIKVVGSVAEHAIDAVSPFDDHDSRPTNAVDEGSSDAVARFCSQCGALSRSDANFCSKCGAKR